MGRHRIASRALLAFVVVSAVIGGLSGIAPGDVVNAKKIPRGGTISFAHTISPTGMDPVNATSAATGNSDGSYFSAVFDMLITENPYTGAVEPKVARSFTSSDSLVWTLKLRAGINFTDGTPYNAEAVKFNWERMADPTNRSPQIGQAQTIASMEVVDQLTLKITLKAANGQFPRVVATALPFVASPTAIRSLGLRFATAPVGAGAFTMKDWVRDNQMTFVKNPNYWVKGQPYIDTLIIRWIPDGAQRYNSLVGGATNVIRVSTSVDLLKQARDAGYKLSELSVPIAFAMFFNTSKPPFNELVARQALDYALDRDRLNSTVYFGGAPPLKNVYTSSHPFYDKTAKLTQFDAKKAQQLFDQYAASHGGQPLAFDMLNTTGNKAVVEFLQAQLAQFKNVSMNITYTVGAELLARAIAGNFQATTFSVTWIDPEPAMSNFFFTGSQRNYSRYSNPEMDAAIKTGRESLDVSTRAKAYKTVQRLLIRDVPIAYIAPFVFAEILGPKVQNLRYVNAGTPVWEVIQVRGAAK